MDPKIRSRQPDNSVVNQPQGALRWDSFLGILIVFSPVDVEYVHICPKVGVCSKPTVAQNHWWEEGQAHKGESLPADDRSSPVISFFALYTTSVSIPTIFRNHDVVSNYDFPQVHRCPSIPTGTWPMRISRKTVSTAEYP